eukprot:GILJ01013118.1.p1 GENE.GILJ01013118.1~~GILJ01013118.1.p1  ORF type:complete len:366 (+),score=70.60 GILJ01013118.1:43-1098(+)
MSSFFASTASSSSSSSKATVPAATLPWIEKYRPRTVDDVSHQEEVVRTLKKSLEGANLPHLLFYGGPGTGKTSTILAIAKQLFGPELYKKRILELNASDDRGIAVVREKVKKFAQGSVGGEVTPGYPCPPFKIIILDEADSMTADAQAALRRIIERYTKVTRFCLICNYISKVIDPLTSRCAKFRFQPVRDEAHLARLRYICEQENIRVDEPTLQKLVEIAEGDLRKSITYLQSASRLYGDKISAQAVIEIAGILPQSEVESLLVACRSNSFEQIQKAVSDISAAGFPAGQFLTQFFDEVASREDITDTQKAKISEFIAEADKALLDGSDEYLQLLDVTAKTMRVLCDMIM